MSLKTIITKILILVLLLLPLSSSAQERIDGKAFLRILTNDVSKDKAGTVNTRIPWIEGYDIRSETREFEFKEQEYIFRITPNSIRKIKAQKRFLKHLQSKPNFDFLEYQCDKVELAHEAWLELFFLSKELDILNDMSDVQERLEILFQKKKNSLDFESKELLEMEIDKRDLSYEIMELVQEIKGIKSIFDLDKSELDFSTIVELDEVMIRSEDIFYGRDLFKDEKIYEINLNENEVQINKAEKKQLFDFFQMRYVGPHDDRFRERFSLELGLNLETSGNQKIKMQELRVKKEELETKIQLREKVKSESIELIKQKITDASIIYSNISTGFDEEKAELNKLKNQFLRSDKTEAVLILAIDNRLVKQKLKLLKKEKDIYFLYLDLINNAEFYCKKPYDFYITK